MYDDEEDQQNSERSYNPDEIGSDPSMLVLSAQKVHTGWRTVVVPWQDQSLSLEFFGVPLPPTPTIAIRIERFSFSHLGRSIRFRLLSHIPELALTLSPAINFLSLRNVFFFLDLGRIDMPFDFGILRNLPCLTHLTFLPLSRPEPMSHIDVSHIIPRSHIHARTPSYFPPLTPWLGLFCLCFWFFRFGMAKLLLTFLVFCFFVFFLVLFVFRVIWKLGRKLTFWFFTKFSQKGHKKVNKKTKFFVKKATKIAEKSERKVFTISSNRHRAVNCYQWASVGDFEIGHEFINYSCDDDFDIGDDIDQFLCDGIDQFSCDDDFEIGDLSENVLVPNDLICLPPTTETLEGRIERPCREYQSANPALEQHRAILPHTVPHVMARNNAVTVTTLEMETDKSSLLSPQCLSDPPLKLPTVTTAQGSAEEERYGKIINPSMELYSSPQCIKIPQLAGPALQPDAFPNVGKIMQVDSSEPESSVRFDAANIGGNVVSANKNCTTTYSQKKITITELLPLIGLTREAAAEKIGVSIPTFKRQCRLNSICRWPHYRNKKQCLSLQQKLTADSDQGAAGAFGHFVTGSHTGAIGSNHHNSPCSKPAKRQREKDTSPSCKTPSTVATCSDPAPAPMQAMSTFPQIMPHLRAGQDARIEISKTTEDILIQSVEGVTTRSCLSPQKRAGSDVPSTSSPKHFHCTEIMDQMLESSHPASKGQLQEQSTFHLQKQNAGTAKIKAKYGDKIVRVPLPATSGIVKLKEELARRLGLKHGSFYVQYEDEDHDWILIACDDALQECLTSSTSRDNQIIRLSVHDEVVNSQNSGKALEC